MGGTFMSLPEAYRTQFVSNLHNSLSGFNGQDIDEAVLYAEQAKTKCIGITIETRPDYCLKPHLSAMLRYGCTRLEASNSPLSHRAFGPKADPFGRCFPDWSPKRVRGRRA